MSDDASEVSVANAYCVVYKLDKGEWVVTGEGWAQIHLYRDDKDGTHRIVGWTVADFNVVINCNITAICKYKKKSEDFHKFTDDEDKVWGFGFYKKEESFAESNKFMTAVLAAIRTPSRSGTGRAPPLPPYAGTATSPPAVVSPTPAATTTAPVKRGPPPKRATISATSPTAMGSNGNGNGTTTDDDSNGVGVGSSNGNKWVRGVSIARPKATSPKGDDNDGTATAVPISRTGPPPLPANVPGANGSAPSTPTGGNPNAPPSPMAPPTPAGAPPHGRGHARTPSTVNKLAERFERMSVASAPAGGISATMPAGGGGGLVTTARPVELLRAPSRGPPPLPGSGVTINTNGGTTAPADQRSPPPLPGDRPRGPSAAVGITPAGPNTLRRTGTKGPPPLPPGTFTQPTAAAADEKTAEVTSPAQTNGDRKIPPPPAKHGQKHHKAVQSVVEAPQPHDHEAQSKQMDDIYENRMVPLGKLKILPPKMARRQQQTSAPAGELKRQDSQKGAAITDPLEVRHTQHVKYDSSTRSYQGLPQEWEKELKQQFGLAPTRIERIRLPEYKSRIPIVLHQMKEYLFNHGGLQQEGIFRLAPDGDESNLVKRQLNENKFVKCEDINCISNLIKVWFRDLPTHLLTEISADAISDCDTEEKAADIITGMSEPSASILLWLLDMCVTVSSNSNINKMTPQNLAIVIGPNLFTPSMTDPMASLLFSQKVASFLHSAIVWRSKNPDAYRPDPNAPAVPDTELVSPTPPPSKK